MSDNKRELEFKYSKHNIDIMAPSRINVYQWTASPPNASDLGTDFKAENNIEDGATKMQFNS